MDTYHVSLIVQYGNYTPRFTFQSLHQESSEQIKLIPTTPSLFERKFDMYLIDMLASKDTNVKNEKEKDKQSKVS